MQEKVIAKSEGDAWFLRNFEYLSSLNDMPIDVAFVRDTFADTKFSISEILEIGCSAGIKLSLYQKLFDCNVAGIDPSKLAIAKAKELFPNKKFNFYLGNSTELNFIENSFDLVIFGFCLYLVDDFIINRSIDEAIRVLKSGGFLVITDFDVPEDFTVPYSHNSGLLTYKRNYVRLFTKYQNLSLVAKKSFSEHKSSFELEKNDRISTSIWFKEPE